MSTVDEEELEIDEESGLRQMEMHTLNQLNSLLKPDRRAPKRQMPCGLGVAQSSQHVEPQGSSEGLEFNLRLIREVRDRSYLYDVLAEAYNNPTWRVSAWNEVALILDCTADQVKTRWKTLRDKFKKEERKSLKSESTWPYYDAMTFLHPHLRDKAPLVPQSSAQHLQQQQQHHELFSSPQGRSQSTSSDKWMLEAEKDLDESPREKKMKMCLEDEGGSDAPSVSLLEPEGSGSHSPDTRDRSAPGGVPDRPHPTAPQDYHNHQQQQQREVMMRLPPQRHYAPLHHAPPPQHLRWNAQDEDEVFGHMIALRLAKMDPRFKESVKVKLMQTLYDAQFGPDSPQSIPNNQQ